MIRHDRPVAPELRKMRSTRTNLGLLAGMVGLILLTVLLNGFMPKPDELATHDNQHALLSAGTSAALFAALIGVMAITGEFRHGTIRPTFVVTPRRTRAMERRSSRAYSWASCSASLRSSSPSASATRSSELRGIPLELTTSHVIWLFVGTPAMTAAWPHSALASARSCETRSSPHRPHRLGDGRGQPPAWTHPVDRWLHTGRRQRCTRCRSRRLRPCGGRGSNTPNRLRRRVRGRRLVRRRPPRRHVATPDVRNGSLTFR